jgi:hypothetical protein
MFENSDLFLHRNLEPFTLLFSLLGPLSKDVNRSERRLECSQRGLWLCCTNISCFMLHSSLRFADSDLPGIHGDASGVP